MFATNRLRDVDPNERRDSRIFEDLDANHLRAGLFWGTASRAGTRENAVRPPLTAGKLLLRVPAEVHGRAIVAAQAAGKSLNQWATEVLQRAAQPG